ncbi:MAG: glycosyltransferase [Terriglobales bacterium]
MNWFRLDNLPLALCAIPFVYYAIAVFSSWQFFRRPRRPLNGFTPPVSLLKPIKGVDAGAYENFASFCRLDYPDYEILFCIDEDDLESAAILGRLQSDFPQRRIRVLLGEPGNGSNDKVMKLAQLVDEAAHEIVVISDSDVKARPDYLRHVVAPMEDPAMGAASCLYVSNDEQTISENLQTVGMISDFYAGILVARQLDGVKFALGPTIVTTRSRLAEFGGYSAIDNQPGDDLLVGRLIAERGHKVDLLPYAIDTVADYQSFSGLVHKRLRWFVVMRKMRPWGHVGLVFTQGLAWSLLAVALRPTAVVAAAFLGTYLALRVAMTWVIGIYGLRQRSLWAKLPLIPLWDALACSIWAFSFLRSTIRWRGGDYHIRRGQLVPVNPAAPGVPVGVKAD